MQFELNQPNAAPCKSSAALRAVGRFPAVPFSVELATNETLTIVRTLRVLSGKRIVGEGRLNGKPVLAKLFITRKGSIHCSRELNGINAITTAGIPTPSIKKRIPLASGGDALLTEFLSPSQTLKQSETPENYILAAFKIIGQLHAAGFTHGDLHQGNLLIHKDQLYLLDGDAVRRTWSGKPATNRRALYNLAQLLSWPFSATRSEEQLLAAYRHENPTFAPNIKRLRTWCDKIQSRRVSHYLERTIRDSTHFAVQKTPNRFTSVRRNRAEELHELLVDPEQAFQNGVRLSSSGACSVVRTQTPDENLVMKCYSAADFPLARHAWEMGFLLQRAGIPTPAPIALIEENSGRKHRRAWLITEFFPGPTLRDHLDASRNPPAKEAAELRTFFESLAAQWTTHGDLTAAHLIFHDGKLAALNLGTTKKHSSAEQHQQAWQKDRARLLGNWPAGSTLHQWLDQNLPA